MSRWPAHQKSGPDIGHGGHGNGEDIGNAGELQFDGGEPDNRVRHLAEGADLIRASNERPGQDQQHCKPLHSLRIAIAKEVRERHIPAVPQRGSDR